MNILITGSEGYIGTNFKKLLIEEGHEFISVDKKIEVCAEDFEDFNGVDAIVHLAALSGIPNCEEDPKNAAIDNISASFNIFRQAFYKKIPVVFASSQAAKTPTGGVYSFTKFAAEKEAFRLNKLGGLIRVYRFANVYGGRNFLEKSTVISQFIKKYNLNEPLVIDDDGHQTRDFIHVDDICRAMLLGLLKNIEVDSPIDIGSGESKSILEVAKMFNCKYENNYNGRSGTASSVANIDRAKNLLDFEVRKNLKKFIDMEVL